MLTATLGDWNKVLQLGFLLTVLAVLLFAVSVAAGVAGPILGSTVMPLLSGATRTMPPGP